MSTSPPDTREATLNGARGSSVRSITQPVPWWAAIVVWLGFVAGFAVALIAVAHPRWVPNLDLAQTEMRVRDVFSTRPPLIGLPGRIGTLAVQGSHPGPLSFWALAPFYKLFGSSSWALQAATACLNLTAIGASLFIARRRGGVVVFSLFAAGLAVLAQFDGGSVLTQAWNPYLPITWFIVFALGVWSVLCDDLAVLPVTAFAACFCLQTHISYLGFVGGFGALAVAWIGWSWWRRRGALGVHAGRWILLAAGIVVITSIPPIIQEFRHEPGNLTLLWRHFTSPPEVAIGYVRGIDVLLVHLNPWRLLGGVDATTGAVWPGVILVVAWVAAAMSALRRRHRALTALNAVLAVALIIGLVSIANIFGFVWYYLMRWAWGINALMMIAIVWSFGDLVAARLAAGATRARVRVMVAVSIAVAITVGFLIRFTVDWSDLEPPTPRLSQTMAALIDPTIRAIDAGNVPGGGRAGRYQVTIVDPVTINGPLYGLLSELDRDGIHAGLPTVFAGVVREKRVVSEADATAVVHLSVGPDIEVWNAKANAIKVVEVDLRSPAERREFVRLQAKARRQLHAIGRDDLVPNVDINIFTAAFDVGVPLPVQRTLLRLVELGQAKAIFIGPPSLAE